MEASQPEHAGQAEAARPISILFNFETIYRVSGNKIDSKGVRKPVVTEISNVRNLGLFVQQNIMSLKYFTDFKGTVFYLVTLINPIEGLKSFVIDSYVFRYLTEIYSYFDTIGSVYKISVVNELPMAVLDTNYEKTLTVNLVKLSYTKTITLFNKEGKKVDYKQLFLNDGTSVVQSLE